MGGHHAATRRAEADVLVFGNGTLLRLSLFIGLLGLRDRRILFGWVARQVGTDGALRFRKLLRRHQRPNLLIGGAGFAGSAENLQPLFDHGAKGLLGVLVMVPFMFVGFDVIPQSAEEVNIPFSDIGRMLMISIIMAVLWYVLIIGAVSMGLPGIDRAASSLPTADATVAIFGGSWAAKLLALAAS